MHLRTMRREDIPAGLRLCRQANWNQVAADWEFFLASSPDGCRVATNEAGEVIGSVATIAYGDAFSWIGMVLVDPRYRRGGVGTRLLNEALDVLGGATTARLDATPAGRELYIRLGFHDEYGLQRMARPSSTVERPSLARRSAEREGGSAVDDSIRRMTDADFEDVAEIDRHVFGAGRRALLEMCRNEAAEYAWTTGGSYVFGRHGHGFEHIGPLVAREEADARRLVAACLSVNANRPCIIDVPLRASWTAWLESMGFTVQRRFARMRRGDPRYKELAERMFAIAGPEFG